MPYKDPERKRQWEREHRAQRNAVRRTRRLDVGPGPSTVLKPAPDPVSTQQSGDGWKVLASIAVGIGIVLVGLLAGTTFPDFGHGQ
jgi:hypothetical protein